MRSESNKNYDDFLCDISQHKGCTSKMAFFSRGAFEKGISYNSVKHHFSPTSKMIQLAEII